MVTPKASAHWASRLSQRCWRNARGSTHRRQWPNLQRRTYASSGEGSSNTHKSGSDLPWAITSVAITVPATYYLLQPQIERMTKGKGHGHGHGEDGKHGDDEKHEEHREESEEAEAKPAAEESTADEGSSGDEKPAEEKSTEEKPTEEKPTEEKPDGEGEGEPSEPTEEASDGESSNEAAEGKQNEDTSSLSSQAGKQKGKQSGLSNAETRHSTDIKGDTGKSKKGEGSIETSKTEGTVDPGRPAR